MQTLSSLRLSSIYNWLTLEWWCTWNIYQKCMPDQVGLLLLKTRTASWSCKRALLPVKYLHKCSFEHISRIYPYQKQKHLSRIIKSSETVDSTVQHRIAPVIWSTARKWHPAKMQLDSFKVMKLPFRIGIVYKTREARNYRNNSRHSGIKEWRKCGRERKR